MEPIPLKARAGIAYSMWERITGFEGIETNVNSETLFSVEQGTDLSEGRFLIAARELRVIFEG